MHMKGRFMREDFGLPGHNPGTSPLKLLGRNASLNVSSSPLPRWPKTNMQVHSADLIAQKDGDSSTGEWGERLGTVLPISCLILRETLSPQTSGASSVKWEGWWHLPHRIKRRSHRRASFHVAMNLSFQRTSSNVIETLFASGIQWVEVKDTGNHPPGYAQSLTAVFRPQSSQQLGNLVLAAYTWPWVLCLQIPASAPTLCGMFCFVILRIYVALPNKA